MTELKCEPEQFQGRIIFMSMFNEIIWWTPRNENNWKANSLNVATYATGFPVECWSAGHIWDLFVRKRGMELTSTSQLMNGAELLKSWRSISLRLVIRCFRPPAHWEEENWKVKVVGRNHSLQRKWRKRWIDSSHNCFCQSAQYQRSSRRLGQRIRSRLCWKWKMWVFGDTDWHCPREHHFSKLTIGTGKLVARLFQEIRRIRRRSEIVETVQRCWLREEDWEGTVLHYNRRGSEIMQTACR